MLPSSRDILLKLSETTSPQKLFPTDCITLYYNFKDLLIFSNHLLYNSANRVVSYMFFK